MRRKGQSEDVKQGTFCFAATVVPRGDGSFVVTPGKPMQKLTIREAAKASGHSVWTIYRLYHAGFLRGEKASPGKIVIYSDSLEAHLQLSRDPEFWDNAEFLTRYRENS